MTGFLGTGWAFPVDIDDDGRFATATDLEVIDRSIRLVLGTALGERIMRPDFGSDLPSFVFRPLNANNRSRMATAVSDALQLWEPRIRLMGVDVTVSPADRATVLIGIDYEVRRSSIRANLVYPFYIGSGVT